MVLDVEWVLEHASEVSATLPGGVYCDDFFCGGVMDCVLGVAAYDDKQDIVCVLTYPLCCSTRTHHHNLHT